MEIKLGLLFRISAAVFAFFCLLTLFAASTANTPLGQSMASFFTATFTIMSIVVLVVAAWMGISVAVTGKL